MKQILTTSLFMLLGLLSSIAVQANIWRVNNNPGVKADFQTAQAANNSTKVLAGDTLHFEPSAANYGDLKLTKRLVLIGLGYFLSENPGNQVRNDIFGSLASLTISNVAANNSVVMVNVNKATNITSGVSGVTIRRCLLGGGLTLDNAPNTVVINTYIYTIPNSYQTVFIYQSSFVTFTNNMLTNGLETDDKSNCVIANNVFGTTEGLSPITLYNSTFQNNILVNSGALAFQNCTVQNNLNNSLGNLLPTDGQNTGNKNGVNMSKVFVNSGADGDKDYKIKSGSFALTAGVNNSECGAFGGSTPYVLALQPPVPSLYKLTAPATASGSPMTVTFSTKSNN